MNSLGNDLLTKFSGKYIWKKLAGGGCCALYVARTSGNGCSMRANGK